MQFQWKTVVSSRVENLVTTKKRSLWNRNNLLVTLFISSNPSPIFFLFLLLSPSLPFHSSSTMITANAARNIVGIIGINISLSLPRFVCICGHHFSIAGSSDFVVGCVKMAVPLCTSPSHDFSSSYI